MTEAVTVAVSRRCLLAAAAAALLPARARGAQSLPMWTVELPDLPRTLVSMDDGGLLAGCDDGTLVCMERASGAIRWQVATGPGPVNRPVAAAGLVLASNPAARGFLHAIDAASGAVSWTRGMNCTGLSAPAMAGNAGAVVGVGGPMNILFAVDLASGEDLWVDELGWSPGPPLVSGTSFITARHTTGRVPLAVRYEAATGTVIGESLDAMYPVAVAGDTLITAPAFGPAATITGRDLERFTARWTLPLETDAAAGWSPGTPAAGPAGIYLATVPGMLQEQGAVRWGEVFAVDPATGARLWMEGVPGGAQVGPVADPDYAAVYVASGDGMYAFDGATGNQIWAQREPGAPPAAMAAAEGWLFMAGPGPSVTAVIALG
ncbi:MAG: PQQ-binding-like beta-propeller repeat protein [Chloroflexota bacterium]